MKLIVFKYNDNAIHLWKSNFKPSKLIIFEDDEFCNNKQTEIMIKKLINYIDNK